MWRGRRTCRALIFCIRKIARPETMFLAQCCRNRSFRVSLDQCWEPNRGRARLAAREERSFHGSCSTLVHARPRSTWPARSPIRQTRTSVLLNSMLLPTRRTLSWRWQLTNRQCALPKQMFFARRHSPTQYTCWLIINFAPARKLRGRMQSCQWPKSQNERATLEAARSVRDIESYLNIRAPFDGIITERNIDKGVWPAHHPARVRRRCCEFNKSQS